MNQSDEYVKIIPLTWDEVLISYSLDSLSKITVLAIEPDQGLLAESTEFVDIGSIRLESLIPDTEYQISFNSETGKRVLHFNTLPAPCGELISTFAVLADPHVSEKVENRKGRLFVESAQILQGVVDDVNERNVEFTLIAGDLTNKGTAKEYETAASILSNLDAPCLPVPGDHDANTEEGAILWKKHFGETQWIKTLNGYSIVGLNSADNSMDADGARYINQALSDEENFPIVLSHLQFVDNPAISIGTKQKTITASADTHTVIESLKNRKSIVYAGHQNIPARVELGVSLQVNIPQPNQYICGYYLVRRYENGFYHTLIPIKSDVLQHYSRTVSNAAAERYGEEQWNEHYREGNGDANFLF